LRFSALFVGLATVVDAVVVIVLSREDFGVFTDLLEAFGTSGLLPFFFEEFHVFGVAVDVVPEEDEGVGLVH